jgi:outer membrane receptor protein involved in Fe transport
MLRYHFRVLLFFAYWLFPLFLMAQQTLATITGTVSDERGDLLPGITLILEGTTQGGVTDASGSFDIKNIKHGKYSLSISGMGYVRQSTEIELNPGQTLNLNFQLKEDSQTLDEITISGESLSTILERSAMAIDALETREIKMRTTDLGEVMARLEGVSVQRAGGLGSDTRFSLNGLTGDQVRFFLDGIPLDYSPYSFGMANVPVNSIERVEIYKGVVPIQFGADALGGAVNLVTSDVPEGLSGAASYQVGSFGTHRITSNLKYLNTESGWFVDASGFYDFAENDYEVDVQVADERGRLREVTLPRFHDSYQAYGINVAAGVKNRKWADELSIKGFYADYEKDVQHNQIMAGIPYGDVKSFNNTRGLNLTYRNNFTENLEVELLGGFNHTERIFLDTSSFVYTWFGERIKESDGEFLITRQGEIGDASHQFTWDDHYFARFNASYQFSKNHGLKLTLAPSYTFRTGDERFIGTFDPLAEEGRLLTMVNGLEYTLNALEGKVQNILFLKRYDQRLESKRKVPSDIGFVLTERSTHHYGYGNGFRYDMTDWLSAKLTYEYAIRMPRQDEVFGDGQFVLKNLELVPERSHNANLELRYASSNPHANWQVKSNLFVRRISDLILLFPATDRSSIYQNIFEANSLGLELSGKWSGLQDKLTLDINTTYQNFYNNSREGTFEAFYGDRIPNTPYFFANGSANYAWPGFMKDNDRLSFFWAGRYVHEFFRSWESAGIRAFKIVIPGQLVNNIGATYELSLGNFRHSLTAEVQNITDARVYDFLGVQRPGRAFYLKLTSQF